MVIGLSNFRWGVPLWAPYNQVIPEPAQGVKGRDRARDRRCVAGLAGVLYEMRVLAHTQFVLRDHNKHTVQRVDLNRSASSHQDYR